MKKFILLFIVAFSLALPQAYGESNRYIVKPSFVTTFQNNTIAGMEAPDNVKLYDVAP